MAQRHLSERFRMLCRDGWTVRFWLPPGPFKFIVPRGGKVSGRLLSGAFLVYWIVEPSPSLSGMSCGAPAGKVVSRRTPLN
jgi:hypothetical protein